MNRRPLILVPTSAGIPALPGLRRGPRAIVETLQCLDQTTAGGRWDVRTLGVEHNVTRDVQALAEAVAPVVAGGIVSLVAGGDHTVAAGSILGVRRGLRLRYGRDVPLYVL